MTGSVPRRTQLILLGAIGAIVILAIAVSSLSSRPSQPFIPRVASLEEAVAVDILDREVLDDLRADGHAVGHVSIDLAGVIQELERQVPDLAGQLHDPDRLAAIDAALAEAKAGLRDILGNDADIVTDLAGFPGVAVRFGSEADLLAAVRLPVVSSIRTNRVGTTDVVQSKAIVRAAEVHEAGFEGQGTYVAVLDTGVDRIGYEGFFPADSIAGSYRARDAQDGDADGSATPEGHGTHVASTVLAMAPRARILSIEVFKMTYYWDDGLQYDALWSDGRLKDGIRHVFDLKRQHLADPTACCNIVAMNFSLGIDGIRNETACADEYGFALARELGIIPVVSAGNSAEAPDPLRPGGTRFLPGVGYLACNMHALNVGATTDGVFPEFYSEDTGEYCDPSDAVDEPAGFSQTGVLLDILAPGNCIVAANGASQGTSMAAPHVAGAVAALVSAKPDAATTEIIEALTDSGTPIEDTRTAPSTTRNRLDMADALAALRGVDTPTPTTGPLLGRIIAVSLEPDEIAPDEALTRGARYQLDAFGVWNRGTLTTQYQLLAVDGGLGLAASAPAEWFTLDPASVTLDPGQVTVVRPVLEVPRGASPGSYATTIQAASPIAAGLTDSILVTFEVSGASGSGGGGLGAADSAGLPIGPVILVGLLAIGLIAWLWKRGRRSA